ncbi:PREDICTED: premnaspirodiene oxygenase-like [Ipomoea nil]|uniref:premnaspirodiene oxygenase-like n=1 Tax=Ipomoea nil TaxID=35883 RepID=UPI000901C36D|nr:PREDICTED: premnaspirodiene oxygenase-like [Ipomoea nil]
MEAAIINFISFTFFLSFFFLVHTQWKKKAKSSGKLPPGPWKLPIIGNLLHLSGSLPAHRLLSDLAKRYGSSSGLMHLQIGEIPAVIVSSREMAKEFLRTHDLAFASRPELTATKVLFYNCWEVAFSPYGDLWRQMRKICVTELLNAKIVRSFSSIRNDEIHRLLAHIRSSLGRPLNMSQRIALFMSSLTCRSALGRVFTGREELVELLEEMSSLVGSFEFADVFPSWKLLHSVCGNKNRMLKIHRKVDPIIENIIKEHEKKLESGELGGDDEGEDIIGVLVKLERNGGHQLPITHEVIKGVFLDIFAAGTETSSTTIVWALSEMMKNPRVFSKAQAEVREAFRGKEKLEEEDMEELLYLKSVVKETLRCHPPVPLLIPRECREETVVCGYTIPVKARVLVNVFAIGRDPRYWEDPESFIPERFENSSIDFMGNNFEYLPFGSGRRICPGLAFGFTNSLSPLAHLLYHFDWMLPPGITVDTFDMTETAGISVGRKTDLVLIPATPIK